jgi:hypothetical protein
MSSPKHPVEEMIDRFAEVLATGERHMFINELLTNYIADFHTEMSGLSDRMAQKTEELYAKVKDLANE